MNRIRARYNGESSKHKPSIRGKISAPIPIASEDDEFPIRFPGEQLATALPQKRSAKQPQQSDAESRGMPRASYYEDGAGLVRASQLVADAWNDDPMESMPARSGTMDSEVVTPATSIAKLERGKGSVRSALGRLFNKKRRDGPSTQIYNHTTGQKHNRSVCFPSHSRCLAANEGSGPNDHSACLSASI